MKYWQFYILLSAIISSGTREHNVVLSGVFFFFSILAMIFPPKSERDKS